MGAPKWTFGRNYNAFIREAREEYDLSLAEARAFYREVRDWKVGPAYGADVKRYRDALYDDPQLVVDSMLYGAPGVVGPVYEKGDYPEGHELGEGAEIELTAETYSDGTTAVAAAVPLHVKIRVILTEPMNVGEARQKLQRTVRTGIVQHGIEVAWIDWRKTSSAGVAGGGTYLRADAVTALGAFYGAIHDADTNTRVEVIHEG